ncbi:MAG: ABC transporter ATP-binding protein [Candidatus Bathyarchaeota archaeon]|nr:ABC transporter ATP-binding protein [Candidatus Bathyarchaeum tardum]WGM89880.1 MAG: ABC transporter ATP-binding protein [Candidatus Bathyarchaeum tardum]WNZ29974.1 MAG: ABC transporter ATP-binding protein [Candidatus Bathyarchaeota archaeon]
MKLTVNDVSFKYNSALSLDQVSLELHESETLGIIGPNGSGKTTLLKCINKILTPKGGNILLDGENVHKMSRMEIAKHIGYVPQSSSSAQALTVFEVVLMGRRPHIGWQSSDKDIQKTWEVLGLLKIEQLAMRSFNELSGGEQQRVILARSLAQEAKVLLLDEPTSNLDIRHQLEVMELSRELVAKQKLAVVVAIHDLNLASRYCEKIVMMKTGKIFAAGSSTSVLTAENIQSVYGVEVAINYYNKIPNIIPIKALTTIN